MLIGNGKGICLRLGSQSLVGSRLQVGALLSPPLTRLPPKGPWREVEGSNRDRRGGGGGCCYFQMKANRCADFAYIELKCGRKAARPGSHWQSPLLKGAGNHGCRVLSWQMRQAKRVCHLFKPPQRDR